MIYRNNKPRIIISFVLCLFFVLLGFANSNAQADCKRRLDDYNRKADFPTGQLDEYETCLNDIDTYFKGLINLEHGNKEKTAALKNDSIKNKNDLNRTIQNNDSTNIVIYTNREKDINKELENLKIELNKNKSELTAYKTTLIESYKKIIPYYISIENPKQNDCQRKLDALNASN